MRKLIILAISLVALAVLIATPLANAATVDDTGAGSVAKGDVQSVLGWNDAKLQKDFASVTFTSKAVTVYDYSWNCSDGSTRHSIYTEAWTPQPLVANPVLNTSAKKVTGWTLDGLGLALSSSFTYAQTGGVDMLSCPTDASPDYATWGMTPTSTNIVQANGIDLPVV
jgi:hypothetical protein